MIIADKNEEEAEDWKKSSRRDSPRWGDIFLDVLERRKRFVLSEGENNCKSKGQTTDAGKFVGR